MDPIGAMQRRMIVTIPKAVWRQDSQYVLFIIALTLCIFGIPALIAIFGFGQPVRNGSYIALAIGAVITAFLLVFSWFKNRRQAGLVVIDLLPIPGRKLSFTLGGLFILMGLLGSYEPTLHSASVSWLLSVVTGLSIGMYQIFLAFSRLEIRKNGIMVYVEFVPWNKIEAFEWVEGGETFSTLKFQYRSQFPAFLRKVDMPVPTEKKQELELLLERYLPGQVVGEKRL